MARPSKNVPDKSVIEKAIAALNNLIPPPKPTIKDVLEEHKSEIMAALERGNKVPQIAKCLSDNGLKTSRETLRQLVELWTQEVGKSVPKKKRVTTAKKEHPAEEGSQEIKQKNTAENKPVAAPFEDKRAAYDNTDI